MLVLRPAQWPDDLPRLASLSTEFRTDRIYRVARDAFSFALVEEKVDQPLCKDYRPFDNDLDEIRAMEHAVVAEADGMVVGFAAGEYQQFSRRMIVWHIYVDGEHRGKGVGHALIGQFEALARSGGARCLWVETQNTNYPAIQFYRRVGFRICGLDESLYDPSSEADRHEVAVFLVRDVV